MVAFDLGAMLGAPQNNINQVQQIAVKIWYRASEITVFSHH